MLLASGSMWYNMCQLYSSETMLLKNVDELFGIIGRQVLYNPNILNEELKNLYEVASDVRLVEGRRLRHFNLLNNYYSLKQSLIGAKLLKKMKDMLELAGDFDDLNKLLVNDMKFSYLFVAFLVQNLPIQSKALYCNLAMYLHSNYR